VASEHILVVDDERDLADLVAINLEVAGYRVSLARDGIEALESIRRERPDLVLLDVMMPRADGWQVLGALQQDETTRDLPVVMLTALAGERDVIRGHLEGAVSYVTKPFDIKALVRCVEEALEPIDEEQRRERTRRIRGLLTRLAELETGRLGSANVRFSRLEQPPRPQPEPTIDISVLARLSSRQREIAGMLAAGWDVRRIAEQLGTSRSNVYAGRKRIAHHLGVPAEEVADEARRLGLGTADDG
jgi:two-component system, OmpR family, alkaline phosphatase synthesis response regulator PhoP